MFTEGKKRGFGTKPNGSAKHTPTFKYKYADIACNHCVNHKICKFNFCPHIVDLLDDLLQDKAFHHAVENAETCENNHKNVLLAIKQNGTKKIC
jgi:hypothetical protein